jgi:tRNA nucleotidyltransferase (CCA-adding enzyme)
MAAPAWLVDQDTRIDEAMEECRRRRTSGVLVAGDGRLLGTATREDLDRAIAHRLAHAPVRAVTTGHLETVAPDASLADVQRALVRSPGGRVPVVRREAAEDETPPLAAVAGVITRSAVLAALGARTPGAREPGVAAAPVAPADLAERLRALAGLGDLWRAVETCAGEERVYLVGGAVRDLLLGEPSFDIDLAVEGDGVAFAERLAERLGGRMHSHEKFHTAVVLTDEVRVDVATARTEHYEYPAALPTVERSTLRQDLFRRDFTINAMAVALTGERFGELVDPYRGFADLDARVVRVLHPLSFIDDPTRIFRAIRYENRYGFRMNAHTLGLARSCVDMGLVGDLSGARVRDELVAILEEREIDHSLARLCELDLARHIRPGLDCGPQAAALARRVEEVRRSDAGRLARWRLRLAVLGRKLTGDELLGWLESLRIRRRDAQTVADAAVLGPRLAERLGALSSPAEVADLLAAHPLEVAVMAAAVAEGAAAQHAQRFLAETRGVRLEIDGRTLRDEIGLPESPAIGRVLAEVLRRKRNGELAGRDAELRAARELAGSVEEPTRG